MRAHLRIQLLANLPSVRTYVMTSTIFQPLFIGFFLKGTFTTRIAPIYYPNLPYLDVLGASRISVNCKSREWRENVPGRMRAQTGPQRNQAKRMEMHFLGADYMSRGGSVSKAGSVYRGDCSARYYMRRATPPAAKFRSCCVKRWLHQRA